MSVPDESNVQDNTKTVIGRDMSILDEANSEPINTSEIITKPDTKTDTTTDTDTDPKTTPDNFELSPTTIAEIDRTFSSAAYHMGDFVTEYRQLRDKMYWTIQSTPKPTPTPPVARPSSHNSSASAASSSSPNSEPAERGPTEPSPATNTPTLPPSTTPTTRLITPLTKTDLNALLLLLCMTTRSLLKREGYLEAKVEELTLELDGQMRIKDDWVLVHGTAIPDTAGKERWGKGGRGAGGWG